MEEFKESTRRAFKQCRTDIDSLKFENQRLKEKLESLQTTNSQLNSTISELTSEMKGIKIALDYIKSFNENTANQNSNIQTQSQTIPQQTPQQIQQEQISQQNIPTQTQLPMYQNQIPQHSQIQQDPYEALLAFKAKSNKRDMLKQKMVSMIADTGMNLAELKFMFVDHHRYCSKATFYNYLKELEANGTLVQDRVNGKTCVFRSETLDKNNSLNELNIR